MDGSGEESSDSSESISGAVLSGSESGYSSVVLSLSVGISSNMKSTSSGSSVVDVLELLKTFHEECAIAVLFLPV